MKKNTIIFFIAMGIPLFGQNEKIEMATFGGGCFWCTEAIFQRVEGVVSVTSGFAGGTVENPSYKQVVSGTTGHAEVIQLKFDTEIITYAELLKIFWQTHDPTTLNRQGNDVGTQYRSIILYHNEAQRKTALQIKKDLIAQEIWDKQIVTEIKSYKAFYSAEKYHQDYYNTNTQKAYCRYVITPKIEKFEKVFQEYLKGK